MLASNILTRTGAFDVSIFGSIMDKIFHHPIAKGGGTTQSVAEKVASSAEQMVGLTPSPSATTPQLATAPNQPSAPASVDVGAVLSKMAEEKGGGGNYHTSIVDLLKLLGLDSSLDARKQLGMELGVHASADGSAEQNIALHKAVIQKLAENGGEIPAGMQA